MSPDRASPARVRRLFERLGWVAMVIVLAAALAFAMVFYLFQARPLAVAEADERRDEATWRVLARLESVVLPVEAVLRMAEGWARNGQLQRDDPIGFNRLLMPVLRQYPLISSIYLAGDDGRMIYLGRSGDAWRNRLTDAVAHPHRQQWLYWGDDGSAAGGEWLDQAYDPRERPWFRDALAGQSGVVHWTEPYIFAASGLPGVTAAVRWNGDEGRVLVMAVDVLLTDISRFTASLRYGEHGSVAILTGDDRLLGLPGDEHLVAGGGQAELRRPEELGLTVLARLLEESRGAEGRFELPAARSPDGQAWFAQFVNVTLGRQVLRVVALAPRADFAAVSERMLLSLAGILVFILGLALLAIHRVMAAVREPVTRMFAEVEETRARAEAEARQRAAEGQIVARLQQTRSAAELGRVLLSELAPRLGLGQALLCVHDPRQDRLLAIAGWGMAEERLATLLLEGSLVEQVFRDGRATGIHRPEAAWFHIASGLGDGVPAEVWIVPVAYGERIFGVLELAGLGAFDTDARGLVEQLIPVVAMSLDIRLRAGEAEALLAGLSGGGGDPCRPPLAAGS